MTKPLAELLGDYRIANVQKIETDGGEIWRISVESMDNADCLSCTFVVPLEAIGNYDLKGYIDHLS